MTLEQQWLEDVKQFGELAYLMWEVRWKNYGDFSFSLESLKSNAYVESALKNPYMVVKRKQSAALPFDLVAARAGDEVEVMDMTGWHNCICDFSTATIRKNLVSFDGKLYSAIALTNLRMKHPRRVGVDYSRFEEK